MSEFTINKKKAPDPDTYISVYTYKGEHDFEDEDGYPMLEVDEDDGIVDLFKTVNAYALKIERGERIQHYVKRGKEGKLYNPIGLYATGNAGKQLRHAGKPLWELKATSERVFNFYIQFLKTTNLAWLTNAERES